MAVPSDYLSGTITLTNGDAAFTGTATGWLLAGFKEGDTIIDITGATEFMGVVATIDANGAGTLTKAWEGPTLTNVAYRMRYQPDGARVSAQARNLIELLGNGNLQAVAGLSGSANQVLMFTGPGTMTTVPKTDLVSGVNYDVQVDLLADRDAYDGQAEGFSVLVADVGDGRAAVYAKASASSADWTDPAYVTGPVGPLPDVTVGTVTTGDPGTSVIITPTPTVGGVELDFTIPAGRGAVVMGDYNPATAYVLDDAVLDNGSTWIALGPTTGNAPPVLPTTSNAWWQLQARKGTDGAGTGDFVGPASATSGAFVGFDGTSGKAGKELTAAAATANLNAVVGDSGTGGTKGLVPAPGAGDAAANKFLSASGGWLAASSSGTDLAVSILALQVADNTNAAIFGPNWVADSFDALTYVDVAGSTNVDTSVPGLLKPTISTTTQNFGAPAAGTENFAGAGYTLIDMSAPLTAGDLITALGVSQSAATNFYIGIYKRNSAGNFDCVLQLDLTHPGGGFADKVLTSPFTVPGTGTYYVGIWTNSTVAQTRSVAVTRAFKEGAAISGGTTGVTGFEEGSASNFPALRVLKNPAPNIMTLRSANFTAAAVPTKMKALLRVKEVDAAVAGTDYVLECTRNGGASWAVMPLTELFTSASPIAGIRIVESAETSVAGQASGTVPRWRFTTVTGKMIELHDVYFYWS